MRRFPRNLIQAALKSLKTLFKRKPDVPEDPHAYVGARKKPRLPSSGAVAVAENPEDRSGF
jgi:hypothetical protein